MGFVAAAIPSFKAFSQSSSSWESLLRLFDWSDRLRRAFPDNSARSQGTIYFWLESESDLKRVADVVDETNRKAQFELFTLGVGSASLGSELYPDGSGPEWVRLAAYLASQQSRASARGWRATSDRELLAQIQSGAVEDSLLTQVLYSIPVSPLNDSIEVDGLEAWATSTSNTRGAFAVLTDLHDSKLALQPDIHRAIHIFRTGQSNACQLVRASFDIREDHNQLFEAYFGSLLRSHSTHLFRAAGDGAAGFLHDIESFPSQEHCASLVTRGRLRSGIAAVPVEGTAFDARALDLAMFVGKTMKQEPDFGALVRADQTLKVAQEHLLLEQIRNSEETLKQAARFGSLWKSLAPSVFRLIARE
jgi:hypothetical protein